MTVSFAQPWTISGNGSVIESKDGTVHTYLELRQEACRNILDEIIFIARASEGAISCDWLMNQSIAVRKHYLDSFEKELKEREKRLNAAKNAKK